MIDIFNLERMSTLLTYLNKDALYTIRKILNGIKTCYTEFRLSRSEQYVSQIDIQHIQKALKEVQNRIDFINLKSTPIDLMAIVSNKEVCDILYEFFKVRISIMDMSKMTESYSRFTDYVTSIQREIKRNKNRNQSEIIKLDELLRKIFEQLDIDDLDNINDELREILARMKAVNEENERLSKRYDGNYSFVKTYIDTAEIHPEFKKEDIASVLDHVYAAVKDIRDGNILILQGRDIFATSVKKVTTAELLKSGLYKKLNLKDWYTELLGDVYANMKLF